MLALFSGALTAQEYKRSNYPYSRADFGCKTPLDKVVDVNSGAAILCKFADLDHRVPLKQAFDAKIGDDKIRALAKDKNNVVWTRSSINRAKGPLSSEGFKKVLVDQGEFDGRRFNRHLRGTIATKQKYGIPLGYREKQFAYRMANVSPSRKVTRRVPAKTFREAIEKVSKKYGTRVAKKVAIRAGGTFVPGPGWVLSGGLVAFDFGWWVFTGQCDICDATEYLYSLMHDSFETQVVVNPVPELTQEVEYAVNTTSFGELQTEFDHVRGLVSADPWSVDPETKIHREYFRLLEAEITKRKFM